MFNLSENYYLRKCYLERGQVPTQSMIKKKMSPGLANVYFKSMTPKLKVVAGLEPPLKGGGTDWYVPPKEILEGRTVLKPVKRELLDQLNHEGIDIIGMELFKKHRKGLALEKARLLFVEDVNWRNGVEDTCRQEWEDASQEATKKNTEFIHNAFNYFTYLYRKSFNKFETLFHEAAIAEINRTREKALQYMQKQYDTFLKFQATMMYNQYNKKLNEKKAKLKTEFIKNLEISRTDFMNKIHDLRIDKHVAVEKLRQFFECQNLACQIYVALKEREECMKEMEASKHKHKKIVKVLTESIALRDLEILLAEQKEKKRREFNKIWEKKVCHVVKKFQMFVTYCLNMLPAHADFFINMEKLMLLQLNQTLEEPTAESIIVVEGEKFNTPVPRPHPFYLFCDKGYKPRIDQDLCPKHCTSSASQLPAIVINKRCIYAACDNFEQFTNKVKGYIHGKRGDDADFEDSIVSADHVPVKYTSSQQLLELKLESSLLKVLQQEIPNIKEVPIKCSVCKIPHCFCTPRDKSVSADESNKTRQPSPLVTVSPESSDDKFVSVVRGVELEHEREPKWESLFGYIEPKKCSCAKTAKKHLEEHLPVYMRHMSKYGPPDLPNYEMCSVDALKSLVNKVKHHTPRLPVTVVPSKTKDMATQYSDPDFELLCTCFSDMEVRRLLSDLTIMDPTLLNTSTADQEFRVVGDTISTTYLTKAASSFATDRAHSLRNLIDDLPELQEIFRNKDCSFE